MKLTSSNPQNNLRTTPIQQSSRQRTIINNSCESPGLSLRSSNSKRDSDSRLDFNLLTLSDRRLKGSSFHRRDRSAEEIFGN